MNYRDTLKINSAGHLEIGGCDTLELANTFGTPLYALDERYIRGMCGVYRDTLREFYGADSGVLYASKAFCCKAMFALLKDEGIGADVVSGGELHTAMSAGFDASKLFFHGNNKTRAELVYALKSGVGRIVIDDIDEIYFLNDICRTEGIRANVLIRVNPGVEAHTHHYIQTSKPDSKFGISVGTGEALSAAGIILGADMLNFMGFHCHIGSQIFEIKPFLLAVDIMCALIKTFKEKYGRDVDELNLGGGFGIWYTEGDKKFTFDGYRQYLKAVLDRLNAGILHSGIKKPALFLEPGRAIVGEAGITLYTVGNIKDIKGIRKYVSVDGGMFENPRFALYQAKYSAVVANRAKCAANDRVTISGKCCESGDIIAEDVMLANPVRGDIIAVMSTGAYNYSMASNYNRNPVPPVVLCRDGIAELIVRPQSYDDVCARDVIPVRLR